MFGLRLLVLLILLFNYGLLFILDSIVINLREKVKVDFLVFGIYFLNLN